MEKIKILKNCQVNSKVKSIKKNLLNFRNLNKLLLFGIIALGIFYIAGVNDLAIKGYVLNDLKAQYGKLSDENKRLELQAVDLSSYSAVSKKISNLEMVAVGNIEYISVINGTVAKK